MLLLLNQTWVHFPVHNKANLLTQVVVKESTAFIAGHQARSPGQLVLKTPDLPEGFQESIFKARWRDGAQGLWSARAQFWLVDGEVMGWCHRIWYHPVDVDYMLMMIK